MKTGTETNDRTKCLRNAKLGLKNIIHNTQKALCTLLTYGQTRYPIKKKFLNITFPVFNILIYIVFNIRKKNILLWVL